MRKKAVIILLAALSAGVSAQKNKTTPFERPKLVVGLVVDQMRWDYLYSKWGVFEKKQNINNS